MNMSYLIFFSSFEPEIDDDHVFNIGKCDISIGGTALVRISVRVQISLNSCNLVRASREASDNDKYSTSMIDGATVVLFVRGSRYCPIVYEEDESDC